MINTTYDAIALACVIVVALEFIIATWICINQVVDWDAVKYNRSQRRKDVCPSYANRRLWELTKVRGDK